MTFQILTLLLLALVPFRCYAQAPPTTFKIAGRVVRASDHRPLRAARVNIARVASGGDVLSATTGENGEFQFTGLPDTKFSLSVIDHGQARVFEQTEGYSTAIVTGPSLDSQHILFSFHTPASLTGTVFDEESEPVRGAQIFLFGGAVKEGRPLTGLNNRSFTNADGHFQFKNISPGIYYVAAFGQPWYARQSGPVLMNGQVMGNTSANPDLDVTFPFTYYAGALTPESATPIKLTEGAQAVIQLSLSPVPAVHVSFVAPQTPSEPQQAGQVSFAELGPGGEQLQLPIGAGFAGVTSIPPGNYDLSAYWFSNGKNTMIGSQNVSLFSDTSVSLAAAVKTSLSGNVLSTSTSELPQGLAILLINSATGHNNFVPVSPTGDFEFPQVSPGRYSLRLAGYPEVYIQKVTSQGSAFSNGELTVPSGAQVRLTLQLAKGVSKVNGIATLNNKPAPGAMILFIPQDMTTSNYIPRDQSDSDGTFTINWAAPGRYTAIAIDNGRDLAYAEPSVIKPYLALGKVIDVPVPKDAPIAIEVQHRQ